MRAALYNQMFGLNGRSFWDFLIGHFLVHYWSDKERIWKRANINQTIGIIKKSKADVVGICEILGNQERERVN